MHILTDSQFTIWIEPVDRQESWVLVILPRLTKRASVFLSSMEDDGPDPFVFEGNVDLQAGTQVRITFRRPEWDCPLVVLNIAEPLHMLWPPPLEVPAPGLPFFLPGHTGDPEAEYLRRTAAQKAYRNREVSQLGYDGENRMQVHYLLDRCLVKTQYFEGGLVRVPALRLRAAHAEEIVRSLFPGPSNLADPELAKRYAHGHPLALLSFVNVRATDKTAADEALHHSLNRALGAISLDRTAGPRVIATIYEPFDRHLPVEVVYNDDFYRGNALVDSTAGLRWHLKAIEHATMTDSWIDFALGSYRNIVSLHDPELIIFSAWALIEAAAKRRVPKSGGPTSH